MHVYVRCSKIWYPHNRPHTALWRTLRAHSRRSKINTWNHDDVVLCIFRKNSGIQTCCEPFAALSQPFATAAKNIHSNLPMSVEYYEPHVGYRTTPIYINSHMYMYVYIYIYINIIIYIYIWACVHRYIFLKKTHIYIYIPSKTNKHPSKMHPNPS